MLSHRLPLLLSYPPQQLPTQPASVFFAQSAAMADAVVLGQASAHGLPRSKLRSSSWEHLSRSLYAPAGSLASLHDRATAFAQVLPSDAAFGHLTAAALRGWWLPWLPPGLPLMATTHRDLHVQRPGVYVRRSPGTPFVLDRGLRLVEPASCLLEVAMDLSLLDLVPMVDLALRDQACSADDIASVAWPGRRGAKNLRAALGLSDSRSESPWESLLRLLHVLAGFSRLEPQARIRDFSGDVVARADLLLLGTHRIHEYDGADHRDREQHERDLARDKALARLGHERYGYTAIEIVRRPGRIVADAEEAYGLSHDAKRLRRWRAAAAESSLTQTGRQRLRSQLERYSRASRRWDRVRRTTSS